MKYSIKCIASTEEPLKYDIYTKTERGYESWCYGMIFDDLNAAYLRCAEWHYPNCYYVIDEYPS